MIITGHSDDREAISRVLRELEPTVWFDTPAGPHCTAGDLDTADADLMADTVLDLLLGRGWQPPASTQRE